MIPIRDATPSRNHPIANNSIIAANLICFLIQMGQGEDLGFFIHLWGFVPARYTVPDVAANFTLGQQLSSWISFMFLHGGFWHLLGNMWFLRIFGNNVEDRLGPFRYVAFYLLCGMGAAFSHMILHLRSGIPVIGASGALAGVMGAYFLLHPGSKILTLIPVFVIPFFVEIRAFFFLGIWFAFQIFNALGDPSGGSGIAWWAHVGGFVLGILFLHLFQALPSAGVSRKMRRVTAKKKTHRLQVIGPLASPDSPDIRGDIGITPHEAAVGTAKVLNIPRGFRKRLVRVVIPPNMDDGKILRLRGMGRKTEEGGQGDLLLRVVVSDAGHGAGMGGQGRHH